MRSAEYSRERLIAICTSMAASGATRMATSVPMMPTPPRSSRWPPNIMPNCMYCASMEMAPPMVAAIVMVSVSWFLMCASSCAMTPASSSRLNACSSPVEAHTAACDGLRPVANALGCGLSMT